MVEMEGRTGTPRKGTIVTQVNGETRYLYKAVPGDERVGLVNTARDSLKYRRARDS